MIDLSYLTEEEQGMIMTVLKRDAELKKSEEERIKHLNKAAPEEGRMKYVTGEWFYEAKSQRHQDRIHGSDIIIASMKQKKPMTVEFLTQSWRERSSKSNNDASTPKPGTANNLQSETSEAQQDRLNLAMRSPSRPRHNPFNSVPINLDLEDINSQLITNEAPGPKNQKASINEMMLPPKMEPKMEAKNEISDTVREIAPRQKPVPRKRTKLYQTYKFQNSVSDSASSQTSQTVSTSSSVRSPVSTESFSTNSSTTFPASTPSISTISDSTSTISTQSKATSSDIRSPPPRGILKHTSSLSSNDANVKSQLPQPISRLSSIPSNTAAEKTAAVTQLNTESNINSKDEKLQSSSSPLTATSPKSRLPVRSPVPLNGSEQTAQEKPKIQPRLSLTSSTRSEDELKNTSISHTAKQKPENHTNTNRSTPTKTENQKMNGQPKTEPLYVPTPTSTSTLNSPLNETISPQISPQKLKEEENKMFKKDIEKTQAQRDHPQNIFDQHDYEATNKVDPALSSQMVDAPPTFNAKTKINLEPEDQRHPDMVNYSAPSPTEEQGDSIAKVLEWFSRSSDSSDKLGSEGSVQDMEDDAKIDDIDFDDGINVRPKAEDNVYLIIPRQSHENTPEANEVFSKDTDWGEELSVDEPEPEPPRKTSLKDVKEQKFEPKSSRVEQLPVAGSSTYGSFQTENTAHTFKMDMSEKASSKEKVPEIVNKKEEIRNVDKLESTGSKLIQAQQSETVDLEENQPPKIANLKTFWERGNAGPKILVSRSNMASEKENKPLKQNEVGKKVEDYIEEPPRVQLSLEDAVVETKDQASVKKVLNVDERVDIVSTGPNVDKYEQETISKDTERPWSFTKLKKDPVAFHGPLERDDISPTLQLKPSSPSLDSGSFSGGQTAENKREAMSINSSEGDRMSPALLTGKFDHKAEIEDKESQTKPGSPPKSSIPIQQPNPVSLPKQQSGQQTDNRAERIKQLKMFWEKEKWEPKIYVRPAAAGGDDSKSPMTSSSKLNKRFTKSEFDLRYIGTDFDDDPEDNGPGRGTQSPNFTVLPLRDRIDKSGIAESMNSSQFKNLREFWAGTSSKRSPAFESKIQSQRPLSPEVKPSKTERSFQSSPKDRNPAKRLDSPSGEPDLLRSSHSSQTRRSSQSSLKDTVPPKPLGILKDKDSRQQGRRSSKGMLNSKGNSLRRATSMFSLNLDVDDDDDDQGQESNLQSKKAPDANLAQPRKAAEVNMSPSRKTPEANSQVKKSQFEVTKAKEKVGEGKPPRYIPEDPDSQPLARSFVPRDYQHYLGISEDRRMFTPPQISEQKCEIVCTPFQTSPETGCSPRCSPVQASTPLGSAELRARRGSLGTRPSAYSPEDLSQDTLHTVDSWSRSNRPSTNRNEENPVQSALRRAAARPIYHKSLEDLTAVPKSTRKSSQVDESVPDSYDVSSTPSPPSSSFSDPEHLRKLSKSVPSFLQKENDEGESDSTSDYSSPSGMHWRNGGPRSHLSSNSVSASSVSGSVMSIYSGDFTSVEVQGTIQFSLNYVQKLREFHIFVVQCKNLAAVDPKKNRSDPYVKSYLISDSSNLGKRKTSVKKRTLNPTYNEILRYRVRMEYLKTQVLNLSVWHNDTFGRNSFLGEIEIDLSTWDFGNTKIKSLSLKSRTTSSIQPADDRGEIRLAVRFLPQLTHSKTVPNSGEVHIWVKDCKNLPLIRGASIDPYVKCFVLPDTSKKSRQKTRVLKRTANPVFNHTMVYDGFRAEDLKEACIELTVWDRDRLANHLLGGLRMGLGTGKSYGVNVDWMDSTAEEMALWERMMELPNEWIEDVLPLRMLTPAKNTWK
ncbi:synaptotagmin-like protein 2 isoform X2 [Astyanax mexicanus]|uniref:synaptotagmin-like protein 2 isoform X2 n=1 Tax=Astyanax mexicanus TaxID=7994 RepID=UPI0020CB2B50|nr:synaptotagmin-like protein 2 isoform X2 [Astyanax mexicanus]